MVLRRGSEKAVSRRCLERPLEEYAPLGERPTKDRKKGAKKERIRAQPGWELQSRVLLATWLGVPRKIAPKSALGHS